MRHPAIENGTILILDFNDAVSGVDYTSGNTIPARLPRRGGAGGGRGWEGADPRGRSDPRGRNGGEALSPSCSA